MRTSFMAGIAAYKAGKSLDENPYKKDGSGLGSFDWSLWVEGWTFQKEQANVSLEA